MIKDYRFKDIEIYLKKDTEVGKEILDAFESLSDAAIIFSRIIFGPQFLPMLELLDVKDRLFSLGRKVYDFIAQKVELDYLDRTEQIRAAYALICYTAYFDVLQDALPNTVRRKLKLKFEKKKELLEESIETTETLQLSPTVPDIHCKVFYADHVTAFSEIKEQLTEIYKRVCNNLIKMIREASIFDEEKKKDNQEFEKLKETLWKLPQKAIEVYEAQYIHLADQFNDFALFAQLQNFEGIHHAIKNNKTALELVIGTTKRIDVGLSNLSNIVNSIETNYNAIQAQDIVDDLRKKYIAFIQEPIIDDREIKSDTEMMSLKFPKIVDAFIPQSYKCLAYQRKDTKLEDESVWKQIPAQHDLDKFFIKYLYSPDSIDYPLVILGQPGSGKSLLTKVLSAQLMSKSYTVIRIPLREVNAEDGIDVLVEDQIKKVTNRSLSTQGYGGFATQFKEKPLIIILDGYDELLQAKGDVFSGYLEKVRRFQQDQKEMERSVRIIITSRITLIDKARIPLNSTILRLLEFDSNQRQKWIDIWNSINADYFASEKINPFSLPLKEKGKKNSIIELAEQPLLLLMLALYDSEANELAKTSNIKRTELYDNLLRRFVRRERRRYVAGFEDKTPEEQEVIIDKEMNRLGVVAIGMYNRQEVVIRSRQLEEDLDTFKARREDGSPKAHTLKESESVLGGFFFIHKSTAQDVDAHSDKSESAYEFLHNTFGEFLAADFILRNTINEVKDILVDRKFKSSGLENKLSNPDSLNSGWFYCLMFVPLYSRPVVIEMLREHITKALKRTLEIYSFPFVITKDDFIDNLQYLVKNQLKMILNTRNSPSVMRGGMLLDRDIPLLGYLSTYSLNLIILACTLSSGGFEFNEEDYTQAKVSALDSRPWDKLTSFWKAWFSPADLMGLSVILRAKRVNNTVILVECNEKFEATRYEQPIDILLCVSFTLGDNLLAGLSGLQTQRFCEITRMSDKKVCEMLRNESPDMYFSYLINLLRKEINGFTEKKESREFAINYREINKIIETIIHNEQIRSVNNDTLLNLFEILEYCLMRKLVFISTRKQLIKIVPRLLDESKYISKKVHRSLEMVSGVRLIQLLARNTGLLFLGRHEDPYLIHKYWDDEWSESINQFIRYSSRYMRDDIYILQDYEENNIYELSLLRAINRLPNMRKDDQERILIQFFELDSMEILAETNPELLSRAVLALLNNCEFNSKEIERIGEIFLRSCLNQLENVEISFLGFDTIINAISIARRIHESWFLSEISGILRYQLFCIRPGFFWNIIYLYPKFAADLIDILPELFRNAPLEIFEFPFFEKEFQYERYGKEIDYIRVFRCLYQLLDERDNSKEMMSRGLHMLERTISEFSRFREIDFSQLTIEQIDALLWYVGIVGDKRISKEIKEAMQQHFKHHRYGETPFFEKIFS